jgi:hypothetical protein
MKYFDEYAANRDASDRLFVRGERLGSRSGPSVPEDHS